MTLWDDAGDQLHEAARETPDGTAGRNSWGHAQMGRAMLHGGGRLSSTQVNRWRRVVLPTWNAIVDALSMSPIHGGAHSRTATTDEAMGRETARLGLVNPRAYTSVADSK